MKVTLIQSNIIWEDVQSNLDSYSEKINSIQDDTDLIVLPEMFATGFSMKPADFAKFKNHQLTWLSVHAHLKNAVISGSIIREVDQNYYNSLVWAEPNGSFQFYDKRHLFGFAGENKHYAAGKEHLITRIDNWRIKPLICYDLRFPVWSRNRKYYDVLLYVANWPDARIEAWKTLLKARAIENMSYVIAVNRVGEDGNGINHSGDSLVVDPKGNVFLEFTPYEEGIQTIELDYDEVSGLREKFPAMDDADDFQITL